MTQPRTRHSILRTTLLLAAAAGTGTVAFALPTPRAVAADAAARAGTLVHLTSVSLLETPFAGDSLASPVLVYATGSARVGLEAASPTALNDTLHLYRLPAMTIDVTEGEVHIELSGAGRVSVGGDVTGGPASKVSATGRHILVLKGGTGIRAVP